MKKIVLVTWIGGGNYGTSLQSFALHRILEMLGYNVSFLSNIPKTFTYKNKIKYLLQLVGINLNGIRQSLLPSRLSLKQQKLKCFISNNYNICKPINDKIELKKLIAETDSFITGSDQIWNTIFGFDSFYFLDFAGDAKRIAYATSIGLRDFPEEHKPEVKRMLSKFSHIGLRENTAVKIVSGLLDRNDVVQVLDPTFLLTSDDWISIAEDANIEIVLPEKYLLCYLIGNNEWYRIQLMDVIERTCINKLIIVPAEENPSFSIDGATIYDAAGPLEFVELIRNASFVCTDSFHATTLAINLNVSFVEFIRFKETDKASQNSRIYDLLSHYDMMNRIYNIDSQQWSKPMVFSFSNKQLDTDRRLSLEYLVNSIEE